MRPMMRWSATAVWLALAALLITAVSPAVAIEIACVEASRYKHLYRIFGNDPARFAKFFNLNPKALPDPEACRAVLVTGSIQRVTREEIQAGNTDVDKLIATIGDNRGGLATLYLASPGGNVATGLRLGFLTRMFWLKAHAVDGASFNYVPDFLSPGGPGASVTIIPPELEAGWATYLEATKTLLDVRITPDNRRRRCVSACTYLHAAGVHRHGPSYFHRARRGSPGKSSDGKKEEEEPSMSELVDGLQRTEQRIVNFYRTMDAGDEAIRAFLSTATQTTAHASMPSMPRYVDDHLRTLCKTRGLSPREQLRKTGPRGEEASPAPPPSNETAQIKLPQSPSPTPLDMRALHHCVAGAHERERMRQFAKLCPNGCEREALVRETTARMRALLPEEQRSRDNRPDPKTR